ncbi:MAG: AAA family ATPase [Chitinophagales bacterium]
MHISKLSIVNYRNFKNAQFHFQKGINTIIGENGAGKTNIFRALRLLLDDSSYQYAYKLGHDDFNRSIDDWKGHWIIISIEFSDIPDDEAVQALFVHSLGNLEDEDKVNKASYTLFFRPKADIRYRLSELEEGDQEGLQEILDEINPNNLNDKYETWFTGKSTANFNDPEAYKELVGDFDNVKFEYDIDSSKFGIKVPHQLSISKEISFTFIKALRDVVSDFHNNRTNPLLSLLKEQSVEIKEDDYEPISQMVNELNKGIEELPDVQEIRQNIRKTIKDAVGETYSPASLSIQSNLSDEANKLLQALRLYISEPGETHEGAIHELSLGGANLIFLALKLLEYQYKSKEKVANFLVIEEPEAHIHTHIQKTLFDKLEYGETQIIYSTHSTHISEVNKISHINILSKKINCSEVYQPSIGLKPEDIAKLERYLDAVRSNLLFAKGVILVEGDAEEILIPIIVKEVLGVSLDELGLSLINIRSTGFINIAQIFDEKRLQRKCSIITDLDSQICDTTINESDTKKTEKYKEKIENSSIVGLRRKKVLDEYCKANDWIKPFYATHTFEVDFIACGNASTAQEILSEVYTKPSKLRDSKNELASKDVSIYGKRILAMANKKGKGWLAVLIGGRVNYHTIIPEYILKAIIFAKGEFSVDLICNIIGYRLKKHENSDPYLDFSDVYLKLSNFLNNNCELGELNKEINTVVEDKQLNVLLDLL